MSTPLAEQYHRAAVEQVAEKYQQQGYAVVVEPRGDDVPSELRPHEPDLLAYKDNEVIIVEIALPSSAKREGFWADLARRISHRQGWHFRIVIAGQGDEALPIRPLPSDTEIRAHVTEARALVEQGHASAALLLAWSMLEAAARLRMLDDDRNPAAAATPRSLLKGLIHFGYLEEDRAAPLEAAMRLRNAVAHGFVGATPTEEVARAVNEVLAALELLQPRDRSGEEREATERQG